MDAHSSASQFPELLARLEADRDNLPWPKRRDLVRSLSACIAQKPPGKTVMSLLLLLASDPKWEVRKDVADCLPLLPDHAFLRLASVLTEDANAFVQKAVDRALDRRRRGQESSQRKRRGLDHVKEQYQDLQRLHGQVVADKAHKLAERLYDVLVGSTVHDMRGLIAPLKSGLMGMQEQLASGSWSLTDGDERLMRMVRQVALLERLVEDMRTYAQPTPAERSHERLADLLKDAHRLALDAIRSSGRHPTEVSITFEAPDSLTVEVAHHQIIRAFSNVIKNAYEAFAVSPETFRSGTIVVRASAIDDGRVEVVITDTGMGLSAEELAEVRRFVPGGTSKKRHGTGFGLAIAKRKVEDHGGGLAMDSEEDVGTTVTITLPTTTREGEA